MVKVWRAAVSRACGCLAAGADAQIVDSTGMTTRVVGRTLPSGWRDLGVY